MAEITEIIVEPGILADCWIAIVGCSESSPLFTFLSIVDRGMYAIVDADCDGSDAPLTSHQQRH